MMDQQVEPMSELSTSDQRDDQDIVSADPTHDAAPVVKQGVEPDTKQTPEETPLSPPANTPGASVNQQEGQEAAPAEPAQPNATSVAAPPSGSRLSPDAAPVEAREDAGHTRLGPDAAPTRTAEKQGQGNVQPIPLLSADVADAFLSRWGEMQAAFVDDPHRVVEQADSLVAEVMQRIAETLAQERTGLERQWAAGDTVSTEDLRLALQHYRSFFQRLLAA